MSPAPSDAKLFHPIQVGNLALKTRVVLAPLTRFRADKDHVHTDLAVEYYSQRASTPGTLLITEATFISPEAGGYDNIPGIWNDAQITAWKKVTDAVHAKGSFMVMQLWALGRASNPEVIRRDGFDFVAASDIPLAGGEKPRPLTLAEIEEYVKKYAQAAKNAIAAGFDGVEVHGANGYLIDQFLQDVSNNRTDKYGGSIENRARFALEVVAAVVAAVGAERTGIRLSPWSRFQDMRMEDPVPTFSHLINSLKTNYPNFLYIHLVESRIAGNDDDNTDGETGGTTEPGASSSDHAGTPLPNSNEFARKIWAPRPYITAGGYSNDAQRAIRAGEHGVLVAFGRAFVSNPDLPRRVKEGIPFHPYDRATFYAVGEAKGYIDQPFAQ